MSSRSRRFFWADDHLADLAQDLLDEIDSLATKSLIRLTSCSMWVRLRARVNRWKAKNSKPGRFRVN